MPIHSTANQPSPDRIIVNVLDHLPQGNLPVNVSVISSASLPESEKRSSIFLDKGEISQPGLIGLQEPGMRFPGYRLLDAFEDTGDIIGLIGRMHDEVNVLGHDDKSE